MKTFAFTLLLLLSFTFSHAQSEYDLFAIPGLMTSHVSNNIWLPGNGSYYYDKTEIVDSVKFIQYRNVKGHGISSLSVVGTKLYLGVYGNKLIKEVLYFDLNWEIGDTIKFGFYNSTVFTKISSITLLNGEVRKMYEFSGFGLYNNGQKFQFVPGIGDINYGLFAWTSFEGGSNMVCCKLNNIDLYVNDRTSSYCTDASFCLHPRLEFEFAETDKVVTFVNKSQYCNSFKWTFGDGSTSNDMEPTHDYGKSGCYIAKLEGEDLCPNKVQNFKENVLNVCSPTSWSKAKGIDTFFWHIRHKINDKIEIVHDFKDQYKTMDGGLTFKKMPRLITEGKHRRVVKYIWWDEHKGLALCNYQDAGTEKKSIFVTKDGGETWQDEGAGSYNISDGDYDEQGNAWIALGQFNSFIYKTSDFGATWEKIALLGNRTDFFKIKKVGQDTLFASGAQGFSTTLKYILAKSYDSGKTWSYSNYPFGIQTTEFINSKIGYAVSNDKLYVTRNGGVTFDVIPTFFRAKDVVAFNDKIGFVRDKLGLVYFTNDGFNNFTSTNCGYGNLDVINFLNDSIIYSVKTGNFSEDIYSMPLDFNITELGCASEIDFDQDGFTKQDDCNDNDPLVNPSKAEIVYNGIDDDCNPMTLDDDLDRDGFGITDDCDDTNSTVHPAQVEVPYNGTDDDCNSLTLDDDLDGDGHMIFNDCDDMNSAIHPSQNEIAYNGMDDDCDPLTLDDDLDGDGFGIADDCDDQNANISLLAIEIPNNGIDEDCDGEDLVSSTSDSNIKIKVAPNPFTSLIHIIASDGISEVMLYDINGILHYSNSYQTAYQCSIPTEMLTPGMYILKIKVLDKYIFRRVLKM